MIYIHSYFAYGFKNKYSIKIRIEKQSYKKKKKNVRLTYVQNILHYAIFSVKIQRYKYIGFCCCRGLPNRGSPVVGAVGEMASMKRRNCARQERMGCVAPAMPFKLGQIARHC